MKADRVAPSFLALLLLAPAALHAQAPTPAPAPASPASAAPATPVQDCLSGLVSSIKEDFDHPERGNPRALSKGALTRWDAYLCQYTTDPIRSKLLATAEQNRQDKQPGASSSAAGSTSLVSKGSSPSLIGFALEHGGLTQTTSGNTATFRGNVVNTISALLNNSYLGSYQLSKKDPLVRALSKLSFGVSFDTTSDQSTTTQGFTPNTSNFSGFSAKYELYNHRDPRDKRWEQAWNALAFEQAKSAPPAFMTKISMDQGQLDKVLRSTDPLRFQNWFEAVSHAVDALPDKPTTDQIQKLVEDAANSLRSSLWSLPKVQAVLPGLSSDMSAFLDAQDKTLDKIRSSPIVTVEYNYTRQLTANNMTVTATEPGQKIPNLSNLNLVFEKGISGGSTPEFTLNTGVTWFDSPDSADPKRGRVRDYQASGEIDVPLKEIAQVGHPVLSFSGQFLSLINEPLGQPVMVNGVTETRTGNIGIFQAKLSIPVKNSGVKIPISFTYATRTELVKEADKRGNIGITLDLDSIFSKPKQQ